MPALSKSPLGPHLLSAIPDFVLSACFFAAWIRPDLTTPNVLRWMLITMLLEFIVVHSAGFMGVAAFGGKPRGARIAAVVGLGLFYTLFVVGFCLAFKTWWPLGSFWLLTLNRASPIILGAAPEGQEQSYVMTGWAASTLFYLLGCFATTVPPIPSWGFTPGVVASMHLGGGGLWIDQPWRAIVFGGLYFGAVGLFELFGYRIVIKPSKTDDPMWR